MPQQLLQMRRRDIVEQLFELRGLRGKNHTMVKPMLMRFGFIRGGEIFPICCHVSADWGNVHFVLRLTHLLWWRNYNMEFKIVLNFLLL